jgi:methyl-accepting chemotaxis protein
MQQTLANNIGQLEQLQTTLQEHEKSLRKAYNHAQKADRMKTTFLHNMTNQMTQPALTIGNDVHQLCKNSSDLNELVDEIQENGKTIAEVLNNIINASDEQMRKEVDHD